MNSSTYSQLPVEKIRMTIPSSFLNSVTITYWVEAVFTTRLQYMSMVSFNHLAWLSTSLRSAKISISWMMVLEIFSLAAKLPTDRYAKFGCGRSDATNKPQVVFCNKEEVEYAGNLWKILPLAESPSDRPNYWQVLSISESWRRRPTKAKRNLSACL